jgi:hypothetical protein
MTLTHNLIERLLLLCFAWLVGLKGHWTILLEGVLYLVQFLLRAGVSSVFSNFAQGLVRSPLSVTKSHTMLSATGMWLAYLSMCPPIVFAFVWLYYLVVTVRRSSGLPKTPTWFKRFLTLICIAYVGEVVVEGIVKLVIISNAQTNQELLDRLATWVTTTVTPVILLVVYVCMVAVYLAFLRQTASLLALDKSSKHHGHLSNSGSAAAAAGGGGDGTVKPTGQGVTTGSTASVGDISVKQTFSPSGGVAPRSACIICCSTSYRSCYSSITSSTISYDFSCIIGNIDQCISPVNNNNDNRCIIYTCSIASSWYIPCSWCSLWIIICYLSSSSWPCLMVCTCTFDGHLGYYPGW